MAIIVNLDIMLAKRKMTSLELAQRVGMTPANLSILKTGKAKAIMDSYFSVGEVGDVTTYENQSS